MECHKGFEHCSYNIKTLLLWMDISALSWDMYMKLDSKKWEILGVSESTG